MGDCEGGDVPCSMTRRGEGEGFVKVLRGRNKKSKNLMDVYVEIMTGKRVKSCRPSVIVLALVQALLILVFITLICREDILHLEYFLPRSLNPINVTKDRISNFITFISR